MAEDSGQERSEEPTAKRLLEARRKGQTARSRELNTFVVLVVGSAGILAIGPAVAGKLWQLMRGQFQINRRDLFDDAAMILHFKAVFVQGAEMLAPFLGIMLVAAFIGPLVLGGWSFSSEAMQPKLEKIDPFRGVVRLFGVRGLIELVKSLIKFLLIFGVTVGLLLTYIHDFLGLSGQPLVSAIQHGAGLIGFSFLVLSASVGLIAVFDVPFQLWDHKRKLKMTLQEVRDEMKDTEGRPEVKNRIRNLQMQMAQNRMMEEVPKADVIVTNPTHFAVALKYNQQGLGAPKVVAITSA